MAHGTNGSWPGRALRLLGSRKCALLAAGLMLFLLLNALPLPRPAANGLQIGFFLGMLFAPYFISRDRRILLVTAAAGGVLLLPKILMTTVADRVWTGGDWNLGLLAMIVLIGFEVVLTALAMVVSLARGRRAEPVCGCLLAYLMLGVVFGDLYLLVAGFQPDAFLAYGGTFRPTQSEMFYFSFITLTTCGYGDIAPALPLARQLAALEAVCGVMYVALFIGRVALRRMPADGPGDDGEGWREDDGIV